MADARRPGLDVALLTRAFEIMGRYLVEREVLGEIAVYGGTAILLQFTWRQVTDDVDAIVREGTREGVVKDAAAYAGLRLGLRDDWLSNAVGAFTPEVETPEFFSLLRTYPDDHVTGLRVFLARPEYLLAMKLKALQRSDVGGRARGDVIRLAHATGKNSAEDLVAVFTAFFPNESLHPLAAMQLPGIAQALGPKPA